MYIAVVGDTVP